MNNILNGFNGNPKDFIMNKLMGNVNPMFANLIEFAQKGDKKSVENFARNMLKERGMDFDTEFANFTKQFKR